jgi:hypothetical protein
MKIFLWSETKPELSTWVYNALSFDMPARSGSTLKAQPNETGNSERVVGYTSIKTADAEIEGVMEVLPVNLSQLDS